MVIRIIFCVCSLVVCFGSLSCETESYGESGTISFIEDTEDTDEIDSEGDLTQDTASQTDFSWETDTNLVSDSEPVCDEWKIDLEKVPARLMILQDISGSMLYDDNDELQSPPTKWDQARSALKSLLQNKSLNLEYGFNVFPRMASDCGVRWKVFSDTKPNNASAISSSLNMFSPGGGTPLYLAMKSYTTASYAPRFLSFDAPSYLLVVSDGADTCGKNGLYDEWDGATPSQLADMTKRLLDKFEVKTFVIGFGKGTDAAQLNAIAAAGGTGLTSYIDARNGSELEEKLLDIASSVVSCVYDLNEQEDNQVNMNKVNFYFDGNVVKMDDGCAKNLGWTWVGDDKKRVEFCKAACDELQSGDVGSISATFGCHQVIVE